jgi:hypothetical protein
VFYASEGVRLLDLLCRVGGAEAHSGMGVCKARMALMYVGD